jgi:hypothetical protein
MPDATPPAVPTYQKFMNPLLKELRGEGTFTNKALDRLVIAAMAFGQAETERGGE